MFVNLNLSIKRIIELNDFLFSFWRIFLAVIEVKKDLKKLKIYCEHCPGDDCGGATPLSIPNREVKTTSAENT
jgi:hypothetical protein